MQNWMVEVVYVFLASKRTQFAFIMGVFFYLFFSLLGRYLLENFELHGALKGIEEVIIENFLRRYDKVAFSSLITLWILAVRFYIKDRNRFL